LGKLGDDLRKRIKLDNGIISSMDPGWSLFYNTLNSFVVEYDIQYDDFLNGHIDVKKNKRKLSKLAFEFYVDEEKGVPYGSYSKISDMDKLFYKLYCCNPNAPKSPYNATKEELKKTIVKFVADSLGKKLRKDIQVVLSLNFADWFLCSTEESWSSCMSLESDYEGSFWAGLPGTIIDKNRVMVYITDERKKTYLEIETDRFLSRSWAIIDDNDSLNFIKFYPNSFSNEKLLIKTIKKETGIEVETGKEFTSKHSLDLLKFDSGDSCFIYQDNSRFADDFKLRGNLGRGGYFVFRNDKQIKDSEIFSYSNGLTNLSESGESIGIYYEEECREYCSECGTNISGDNIYSNDNGDIFCSYCFNDIYCDCYKCGRVTEVEELIENVDGEFICNRCFDRYYATCDECGDVFENQQITTVDNKYFLCSDCMCEKYYMCETCEEFVMHGDGNGTLCNGCLKEKTA